MIDLFKWGSVETNGAFRSDSHTILRACLPTNPAMQRKFLEKLY